MAWVTDTNFGSSHFAIDATAPFATGGGNRVLQLGTGVIYENSISSTDVSITWDFVGRTAGASSGQTHGGGGMRDASGNIYFAEVGGRNNGFFDLRIGKYTQSSDLATILSTNGGSLGFVLGDIVSFELRKENNQISILVNGAVLNSIPESTFSGPFTPCIVGGFFTGNNEFNSRQIDNLQFNSL